MVAVVTVALVTFLTLVISKVVEVKYLIQAFDFDLGGLRLVVWPALVGFSLVFFCQAERAEASSTLGWPMAALPAPPTFVEHETVGG